MISRVLIEYVQMPKGALLRGGV